MEDLFAYLDMFHRVSYKFNQMLMVKSASIDFQQEALTDVSQQ